MKQKKTACLALAVATATALAFGGAAAASAVNSPESGGPSASESSARANAPIPDTDTLRAQTRSLGDLASVLRPVTELLDDVLKADGGKLTAGQANQHTTAVREALAGAQDASPAGTGSSSAASAADQRVVRAGAELQTQTETLITAATQDEPDAEAVKEAVAAVVSGAVQVMTATTDATTALAPTPGDDRPTG